MPSAVSMPGQHTRSTRLSRLAAIQEPRFYPAWRRSRNPGFIPLGGDPGTQVLSRLAAIQESRFYPAWRRSRNLDFIPLGGYSGTQALSRLAAIQEPRFYLAWQQSRNPGFVSLGSNPGTQVLSRLAALSRFIGWMPQDSACISANGIACAAKIPLSTVMAHAFCSLFLCAMFCLLRTGFGYCGVFDDSR